MWVCVCVCVCGVCVCGCVYVCVCAWCVCVCVRKCEKLKKKAPEYLSFCHKIKRCISSWKSRFYACYWKDVKNVNKCMMKTANIFPDKAATL